MKNGKRVSGGNAKQRRYLRRFYERRGWKLLYWMTPRPPKSSAKPVASTSANTEFNPPSATVTVARGEEVIDKIPVNAEKAAQVVSDSADVSDTPLPPIKKHPAVDFFILALAFINHGKLKDPKDYLDDNIDDSSWAEAKDRFLDDERDVHSGFQRAPSPNAGGQPAGSYCASGYRQAERPVTKRLGWFGRLICRLWRWLNRQLDEA